MIKFQKTEEYTVCSPSFDTNIVLGDFIKSRKIMMMNCNEFIKCFVCNKKLDESKTMHIATIAGVGNRCLCDTCTDWVNSKWEKQASDVEEVW